MTTNILLTPPSVEPVSLQEMKAYARVDHDADDGLIADITKASREWCEQFTGRAFIAQTWRHARSYAPSKRDIVLPRGPFRSLLQILLYDADGESSAWDIDNVYSEEMYGVTSVILDDGVVWPPMKRGMIVDYVAGYGETAGDVPASIKLAIKQLALHWYENREAVMISDDAYRVPMTVEALLQPYRILRTGGSCV